MFFWRTVAETVWIRKQHTAAATRRRRRRRSRRQSRATAAMAEMPRPARADRLDLLTGKSSRSRRSRRSRRRYRRAAVGLTYLTVSRATGVLRPEQKKRNVSKEGEGANTGSCFVFARNPWKRFRRCVVETPRKTARLGWLIISETETACFYFFLLRIYAKRARVYSRSLKARWVSDFFFKLKDVHD